jgi:NAD-dependent dihydropyrimidine dehydrogenase PreA subunit
MRTSEVSDPKFAKWKGIDRGTIRWNPSIDKDICTGCGMCVTSCGRNVFDFDLKKNKSVVARPDNCMVGCTSCETWCIFNAISFPDKQYVKDLIKEKGLLAVAKKELNDKVKLQEKNKRCSCVG